MPPKRAAAVSPSKTESPSRRKGGRPKKVEEPEEEAVEAAEDEAEDVEEPEPTPSPKKRGRPRRAAAAKAAESSAEADDMITLSIEDLMDIPEATASPAKKRKAPAKSAAAKRGKSDTSLKDAGGAGDGENLIQCTLCDAKVVQLVRHIRAQHGDDPDYDSKIKEARGLEAKMQSSTPRKPASTLLDDLTITVGKMEKSPIVEKRAPRESGGSLVRPKNTQCPICEKVVRRYDLNKHIRNVHSGEKPNKCPYCDYASPWKGNLNTHIAGVHTKARLHDCIRCGLSFKTRSAMIGHVRKVHDKMYQPKERLFECEECNKKFYKKFHLQRHIRVHTGEKPFTCAFCEKMFASKTNMDSHIQSVHLKIKPFKCGYCDKGFARKKMMLIHIRKYHMNKDDSALALAGLDDVDDITLDDNMDNESNASVESGEILGPEDGVGPDMVLIKMRDDGTGDNVDDPVRQYMFVPADELPEGMDDTMNTTAGLDTTSGVDQSLNTSQDEEAVSAESAAADEPAPATSKAAVTEPVVINVEAGQVVQALQTDEGIVLVTQAAAETAEQTPAVEETPAAAEAVGTDPTAAETQEAPAAAVEEPEAATEEPDLVQQALAETVPEVSDTKENEGAADAATAKAIISADTELTGGLPANLLASEGDAQETAVAPDADFEFLNGIESNGN